MRIPLVLMSLSLAFLPWASLNAQEVRSGADAFGGWANDAPGVRRHITPADLPPPSHTDNDPEAPDFKRMPKVVAAPEGVMPKVPAGFKVEVFASGLNKPRVIKVAPNGDIFVAESGSGRILVFPAASANRTSADRGPAKPQVFAENLNQPYGVVFHPPAKPQHVYVGAANQVVRYPYTEGNPQATGPAEVVIPDIPTKRHWTRDLEVSRDGKQLFLAVGSASNAAGTMPKKSKQEIAAHEKTHGLGAAWGDEENRAVVRVFDPAGKEVRNYATGIRNCSGMTMQPESDILWCTGNERDHIGPNLAPDFVTRVEDGGFYGWPWYYTGANEDPAHAGSRPDLEDKVITPDVLVQAHSSIMDLVFYDSSAFPAEYRGDAFAALHGSWNRDKRTGYKVIRVIMEDGKATGVYEDFMTGFVLDEDTVWGRPVGIAVARDGALLVSDDGNGTIFRITHGEDTPTRADAAPPAR